MSLGEFHAALDDASAVFTPAAYYDEDGDCIEFIFQPDPFYAERESELLTIYRSRESGEIVGSLVKRIKEVLRHVPGIRIDIRDNSIAVRHIIRAVAWSIGKSNNEAKIDLSFRKLLSEADAQNVEVNLDGALCG